MKRSIKTSYPLGLTLLLLATSLYASGCDGTTDGLAASGTVEATEARLGFLAVGRIEEITVAEGDPVERGQELARLERQEIEARRQQAEAQVAAARALLAELELGSRAEEIASGEAGFAAANERLTDAGRDRERARRLREGGAISQEALDKANSAFDVARSLAAQSAEQLALLKEGPRAERIQAQQAQLEQAEAAVRAIEATIDNMVVLAPFAGLVTVRHREPGETVPLGAPVLTVMRREDRWIRIYIPENRIGAVHIGQGAEIACDTYPEKSFKGEVIFIASEAEFTPKSVQTTEERVKLVYAVKVRITDDTEYDLKVGVPADVRLNPAS